MSAGSRIFGLDLIRAVAILLVCLLHGRELIQDHIPNFPQFWYVDGVDLFFSLSGFLIGGIFIKIFGSENKFKLKELYNFWIRRWFRTLPNYYLILFANIALSYVLYGNMNIKSIWKYFVFLQNFTYLDSLGFFGESWSLCVEEWFYLMFPLVCVMFSFLLKGKLIRSIFASSIFIIIFFIVLRNLMIIGLPQMELFEWVWKFRAVVIYRLDSIVFGVFGAYISIFYSQYWFKYRYHAFVIGILGIFYGVNYYNLLESNFKMVNSDTLYSVSILCLLPLMSTWKTCNIKVIELPVTFISKISYSMYLINASLMMRFIGAYLPITDLNSAIVGYIFFWVATIVLSYFIFSYYEKPTTALRDKFELS